MLLKVNYTHIIGRYIGYLSLSIFVRISNVKIILSTGIYTGRRYSKYEKL